MDLTLILPQEERLREARIWPSKHLGRRETWSSQGLTTLVVQPAYPSTRDLQMIVTGVLLRLAGAVQLSGTRWA